MLKYKTTENNIIKEFNETGALLSGHFILSAGVHSDGYVQCSRVLMHPHRAGRLCELLAHKINRQFGTGYFDVAIGPAMGGVIVSYELARHLNIPAMFCERVNGVFQLRRGFQLNSDMRILVVEDVITTGKSSIEAIRCVEENGGKVVAVAALVNRNITNIENIENLPLISLLELDINIYQPDQVPAELAAITPQKPGSRFLQNAK